MKRRRFARVCSYCAKVFKSYVRNQSFCGDGCKMLGEAMRKRRDKALAKGKYRCPMCRGRGYLSEVNK